MWLVVGFATALVTVVAVAVVWTASARVTNVDTAPLPSTGAWIGRTVPGSLGVGLRDTAFEFTVYRLGCAPAGGGPGQRCQATVGVRNITDRNQLWYGALQRAYLPGGNWVNLDEAASRTANGGKDAFADPVPAHAYRLVPMVFTSPGTAAPTRIELRGQVFSAGVSVGVP